MKKLKLGKTPNEREKKWPYFSLHLGWLVGWLVGRLVGWLVGWLIGILIYNALLSSLYDWVVFHPRKIPQNNEAFSFSLLKWWLGWFPNADTPERFKNIAPLGGVAKPKRRKEMKFWLVKGQGPPKMVSLQKHVVFTPSIQLHLAKVVWRHCSC